MQFNDRRQTLFRKSKSLLAEPVAWLLVVTYEPRTDGTIYHHEFERLVQEQQAFLRAEVGQLTSSQGGRVEKVLTDSARRFIEICQCRGLSEEGDRVREALERCKGVARPSFQYTLPEYPESEPERICGESGKPIGLWR